MAGERAGIGRGAGEVLLRFALLGIFCYLETLTPFIRYISPQEMETEYKHPRRDAYVPSGVMWALVFATPTLTIIVGYVFSKDRDDLLQSLLAVTLALGVNAVLTDTVKLVVGRPRPDFFYRCFPDGVMTPDMQCTGDRHDIIDGRVSFPSGHSSFTFCSLGFVALWLCGRLGVLAPRGRANGVRMMPCLVPLYSALLVALSRSCDYHHHWQDILAGSLLGLATAHACYTQYYHPLSSDMAGIPYVSSRTSTDDALNAVGSAGNVSDRTPLLNGATREKWFR